MEKALWESYKELYEKTQGHLLVAISALAKIECAQWNPDVSKKDASKIADEALDKILHSK